MGQSCSIEEVASFDTALSISIQITSSSEKMKLELQKAKDEFKTSESDWIYSCSRTNTLRRVFKQWSKQRKKLLKYLRTDWGSYCLVFSQLGLRDNPDFKISTCRRKTT